MMDAILTAVQTATADDVMGYVGVYIAAPLGTLWLVNQVKRSRKNMGRKLTAWQLRVMAAMVSGLSAIFFGNRMAAWSVDKAVNHGVVVAFLFPLLATWLIGKVKAVAPGVAEDMGDLPTELRAADTTEFAADKTTIVRDQP